MTSSTSPAPVGVAETNQYRPILLQTMAYSLVPGAVQGCTTVLLGHPLDTAKTRLQTSSVSCNAAATLPKAMRDIVRKEGPAALYRGVTPPIVMMCTKRSLQFALFESFFSPQGGTSSSQELDNGLVGAIRARLASNAFLSGALAGVAGTLLGCPMHVVKIQTQNTTRDVTSNAWACAVRIARTEGLRGFYRGLRFHMLKDASFASTYLGSYNHIMSRLRSYGSSTPLGGKTEASAKAAAPWWAPMIGGSVASMLTWTVLYPLDTIKTLVQAKQARSMRDMYATLFTPPSGPRQVTSHVFVLYRGLGVALARAGPVSGIAMFAYESAKKALSPPSTPTSTSRSSV